ncbi:ABC transporter permease [Paenibacillus cymbidii]|uniref:ABC transporter permease n=1 Tax=Paenibacillus cymbidii TaxID=1639034 RepID=UPI0038B2C8F1
MNRQSNPGGMPVRGENSLSLTQLFRSRIWSKRYAYLLILPGLLYFIVYKYVPMLGTIIAFQDFSPFLGFADSPWVGLKHIRTLFAEPEVIRVLWNTLSLSFLQILFAFPAPIILALMMNEIKTEWFKRIVQSVVYLPHFLSWVVVVSIFVIFLRSEGIVNGLLREVFGLDQPIAFLNTPSYFQPLIVLQVIWKEVGWGTIIFLAALAGVDPSLYEASVMDGASRMRRIWHITLPAIRGTIVILLVLRLGHVLDSGFEQVFLMLNPYVDKVGNVLDTYAYFKGIINGNYSLATAVGLFKGVVGFVLVVGVNWLVKRSGEDGVY